MGSNANGIKFIQPGEARVGRRWCESLDLAVDYAIDLERQKHTIEGIEGPNGETYDREGYAKLRASQAEPNARPRV
jgi:hypothetical protein